MTTMALNNSRKSVKRAQTTPMARSRNVTYIHRHHQCGEQQMAATAHGRRLSVDGTEWENPHHDGSPLVPAVEEEAARMREQGVREEEAGEDDELKDDDGADKCKSVKGVRTNVPTEVSAWFIWIHEL